MGQIESVLSVTRAGASISSTSRTSGTATDPWDLVVEDRRTGAVAGVEVKLGAAPTVRDARHLAVLRDGLGTRFTVGVVVHTGPHPLPLGERLWAVPVSTLWRAD